MVEDSTCVMDYTSEFTTYEIFKNRNALCNWARDVGRRNGLVIVIKRSDSGSGRKERVTLGCERGGHYRNMNKNSETQTDKKRKRETGTKKCGCPFALKGSKLPNDNWMLTVFCGVHNHPAAKHLEGHSFVGRLSQEETSLLVDLSKTMVRPKEILSTLKQNDVLNVSTIKTIYNARQIWP
ncbi:hypothetical protein L1049_009180 [Liquidambar formosana]|uniref:Uncharacterized protein n=1 Tax=Liquidambar formosana TaxID=63359 RepID=A0AAP0S5L1_LIQFO